MRVKSHWHNTIGCWTSLMLIVLTLTGVIISYQWAGSLLYTLNGNVISPPQQNAPNQSREQTVVLTENLENAVKIAENQTAWKTISLRLPVAKDTTVFTIEEGIYANQVARSTLTVEAKTAQISKWGAYGEQNAAR